MSWQKDRFNVPGESAARIPCLEVASLREEEFEAVENESLEDRPPLPRGSPLTREGTGLRGFLQGRVWSHWAT